MKITCVGCTHGDFNKLQLPRGDLLIITGDITAMDEEGEYCEFLGWLYDQDYSMRIIIAGNHDNFLNNEPDFLNEVGIKYLCDSGTEFVLEYPHLDPCNSENDGKTYKRKVLKIWGSPWSLWFHGINPKCTAFTGNESDLASKFSLIPDDVDILITHTPPFGILDQIETEYSASFGSMALRKELERVQPMLHVFSHIHEQGGKKLMLKRPSNLEDTICVNCSIMNEKYKAVNEPMRIEL